MLKMVNGFTVFEDAEGESFLKFDEWLEEEEGQQWEGIRMSLIIDDKDEEEIEIIKCNLLEQFYDWCFENDVTGYEE